MRRQSATPTLFPLALWWQLGLKTWEMLTASGQVIGHRVTRMAVAGPKPSARDRREFTRMGSEKLQAAGQSGWAMAAQMQTAWWRSWMQLMLAGLAPVHRTATANARRLGRIPGRRSRRR
jgi:hypothetical protein